MNTYKAIVEYLGTEYCGFQKQNTGVPTIQNSLEDAIAKVSGTQCSTLASGRTDAGVHARGQVIKISMEKNIPPNGLKKALNDLLPRDIFIRELESCHQDFHPIRDSKEKEYRYQFTFNQELDPISTLMVTNFYGEIDIEKMREAAAFFVGEFDFCNYQTVGTEVDSTIRTIYRCKIVDKKMETPGFGQKICLYELQICGSGFLKQMVRLIMGVLLEYGRGKLTSNQIKDSLMGKKLDQHLGPVAPPQGLILHQVNYPIH